jgi:hemerythrin-like domain-containing protein
MESYLNSGIKEVCTEFPEIGKILEEFDVGCNSCLVGTCLLKDVVEIHNLTKNTEKKMMDRIKKIIDPNFEIDETEIHNKTVKSPKKITYSPPLKKLVNEHKLILRWAALIPKILESLDLESVESLHTLQNGIKFIREFADKFHHAKEEEVLFKYFDENLEILNVMHADHETVRALVRELLVAIENKDIEIINRNLLKYKEILLEHIKKEDEILYPWMDRNLNISQKDEIFAEFDAIALKFQGLSIQQEEFILNLEKKFKIMEMQIN